MSIDLPCVTPWTSETRFLSRENTNTGKGLCIASLGSMMSFSMSAINLDSDIICIDPGICVIVDVEGFFVYTLYPYIFFFILQPPSMLYQDSFTTTIVVGKFVLVLA
ncbi:hypothetical protein Tco_0736583 [Tanacetum coccineum]